VDKGRGTTRSHAIYTDHPTLSGQWRVGGYCRLGTWLWCSEQDTDTTGQILGMGSDRTWVKTGPVSDAANVTTHVLACSLFEMCIFFLWHYSPRWISSSCLMTFLNHTQLDAQQNSPGWLISQSKRPVPTQDKHQWCHQNSNPQSQQPSGRRPLLHRTGNDFSSH
jgi:hypothetical protein